MKNTGENIQGSASSKTLRQGAFLIEGSKCSLDQSRVKEGEMMGYEVGEYAGGRGQWRGLVGAESRMGFILV